MKAFATIVLLAMGAGIATAQVLFVDFAIDPGIIKTPGVELENPEPGIWYHFGGGGWREADGTVRLARPGNDGGIATLIYVIDSSQLTSGKKYSVNLGYAFANNTANKIALDVWQVDYGTTGKISVESRTWFGGGNFADLRDLDAPFTRNDYPNAGETTDYPSGDYSVTELVDADYFYTDEESNSVYPNRWLGGLMGSVVSSTFTYDGTGNILLRIMSYRGNAEWFVNDLFSIEVVEAPISAWAGYEMRDDGYVDTGSFLGWIWVGDPGNPSDWVWLVKTNSYIYLPEEFVDKFFGTWLYIPRW